MKIELHAQDVSDIFWRNLSLRWAHNVRKWLPHLDTDAYAAEYSRQIADYNTGSIPSATAVALLILGHEMRPKVVFEVGTFIGNSTRVLALTGEEVYTCDGSNDIKLNMPNITQYPKTMSTAALELFKKTGQQIDLLFVDGRLQPQDMDLLRGLVKPETVIALDDCYQLEKGMVNVSMLLPAQLACPSFYIPPPRGEPFATFGVPGGTTLGLVVPSTMLGVSQA